MMDNASNNDTLVAALEVKFKSVGIAWWDALEARMRCFPHTTHLAVLKVRSAVLTSKLTSLMNQSSSKR
jgi:hypothetical protein